MVQIGELAAFALVAHPDFFQDIPSARTLEKIKNTRAVTFIFLIQRLNSFTHAFQQFIVAGFMFFRRIAKIRQQREENIVVAVGEIADFERFEQRLDAAHAGEHRRHDHHRRVTGRNAFGKIETRQRGWRDENRDEPIDQRHGQLTRAKQRQQRDQAEHPV